MTLALTDEQKMIRTMVREFARDVVAPGAAERDRTKTFPAEILRQMGELGLMGMMIPPQYGGSGADTVSYVLALAEIAGACAATAVVMSVQNSIVCESLHRFGSEAQKQRYLVPLAKGEKIGAFALTEPDAGSDPVSQSTRAAHDGDGYLLNGTKRFITSGRNAQILLVTAKTQPALKHKGISTFILTRDDPGFKAGHMEDKLGLRASDTTDVVLSDCRIPADRLLGDQGQGFTIAMQGLDGGRIGIAAQSIGVATAALDAAVAYTTQREQFGRKVSKFQGLRWMIADMATELEAARQLTLSAAAMKDRGEDYTRQASMAKLFASEMVNRVTARALQLHGGYGYTKEYPVERYYRDARVFTIYEGTSEIQRVVISNHIFKDKRTP
jgi:butyryl-CoA dehydrogenase